MFFQYLTCSKFKKTLHVLINFKAGPTGIEPAAYGLRVRRSGLTELRARIKTSFEKGSNGKYRAYG
jgi:hypothetical protein